LAGYDRCSPAPAVHGRRQHRADSVTSTRVSKRGRLLDSSRPFRMYGVYNWRMSSRTRYAMIALAALGLVASLAALYVHYRLLTDPSYSSFCDINATVSCQQVFQSRYGTLF